MATTAPDRNERYPTAGPTTSSYDDYRFVTTNDGEALIYDETTVDAWVQSVWSVSLDSWC